MKKIIVAIDGHSSCGKSTMAKDLAKEIGYIYVDTGAMYRAITLLALRNQIFTSENQVKEELLQKLLQSCKIGFRLNPETNLPIVQLNGIDIEEEIRTMEVSSKVSHIAAISFVREYLTEQQRAMGTEKGIVMDGRDIGTVVFPHAELKIFVTASAEVRAKRRYDELTSKGQSVSYEEILANVQERDYIDSHREVAPLRKADDAVVLDNSFMTIPEQKSWLLEKFNALTTG